MGTVDLTQLGVSGIVALLLIVAVVTLWKDNRELRQQMRQDQAAMLPALEKSTEALRAALEENIRARALAQREGR